MIYVGILYENVIVSKAKNYEDVVHSNEIELTEGQYNTIPIPCQLINGEFVECDFPETYIEILSNPLAIIGGGTGATTAEEARENLGVPTIVTGTYTGDGNAEQFIDLGFTPSAVIVMHESGPRYDYSGGIATKDIPCRYFVGGTIQSYLPLVSVEDGGFKVYVNGVTDGVGYQTNNNSRIYNYIAIIGGTLK